MIDRYYIDSYGIEDIDPKGKWVYYTDHEQALAANDLQWKRRVGLDCGGHSCFYAIDKTGMRHNGPCSCSPKRTKEDHEQAIAEKDREIEHLKEKVAHYDRWLSQGVYFTNEEFSERVLKPKQQLMEQAVILSKALQEVKTIAFLIGNDVRLQPCRDMGVIAAKALTDYEEAFLQERETNGSH